MKFVLTSLVITFLSILTITGQNNFNADFESFETTPYFFRFGNNSSTTWYPRWKYSHNVSPNPLINNQNNSATVLKYTSLEARWYGLKIKFPAPLNFDEMDTLSFDIYQPESIVGKAVNPNYNSTQPATNQQLLVKLLTNFNTIRDNREDAGVRLNSAVADFTSTGAWVQYKVILKSSDFNPSELEALAKGVLGIAIMPTYNSPGVTLQQEHTVYIDNIRIRPEIPTGTGPELFSSFKASWNNGLLAIHPPVAGTATVRIFDAKGSLVQLVHTGALNQENYEFQVKLPKGIFFVSLHTNNRYYNQKIISN